MKMLAGIKEYEDRLRESKELITRLENGRKKLKEAERNNSIVLAFKLINQYEKLAKQLVETLEECAMIHQHFSQGKPTMLKRDGSYISSDQFMTGEEIELDPWLLSTFKTLKDVFGEHATDMIHIEN